MYPKANVVEETCSKLATIGMNAVLSPQASGPSITRTASGDAAASDPPQQAASHHLWSFGAKSTHPSTPAMSNADDVDRLQSVPQTAVFAGSRMESDLHSLSPAPGLPSKALLTGSGCEPTQGTSDAAHCRQEEGASRSQGASQGVSQGAAHQLQSSPSSAAVSGAAASQAADQIEVQESNHSSSSVRPVGQNCSTQLPYSNVQECLICGPH